MPRTIKVSGLSDELLAQVDRRWQGAHYADRSEYLRDLIRRDALGDLSETSISRSARVLFSSVHDEIDRGGFSEAEIERDVTSALAEVRRDRRRG